MAAVNRAVLLPHCPKRNQGVYTDIFGDGLIPISPPIAGVRQWLNEFPDKDCSL
jgi:uncharacterized protein YbgA (DUF1722 family)